MTRIAASRTKSPVQSSGYAPRISIRPSLRDAMRNAFLHRVNPPYAEPAEPVPRLWPKIAEAAEPVPRLWPEIAEAVWEYGQAAIFGWTKRGRLW